MNNNKDLNEEYFEEPYTAEDLEISEDLDFAKDYQPTTAITADGADVALEQTKKKSSSKSKHNHGGHRQRMYKRYEETTFDGFAEHEVLEMLLYLGIPQRNTNQLAHDLIKQYNNLENILEADYNDLIISKVPPRAALILTQFREVQNYIRYNKPIDVVLNDVVQTGEFCCEHFGYDIVESFYLISLGSNRKVKAINRISRGTVNRTDSYPAKILKVALRHNACGVILCHNHPGGNLNPSTADIVTTQNIIQLLEAVDIPVFDHIICSKDRFTSLFERGYIHC